MRTTLSTLLASVLTLCCAVTHAQNEDSTVTVDRLRFSGFGTLGLVHDDAPDGWSFRRDFSGAGSRRPIRADVDSRLGLQLNYQATPQIELVGQTVITRLAPYAKTSDLVQSAFVAFRPRPEWTLRVGRVSTDQYLVSDYRSVGFAYPVVRPPVEFYGVVPGSVEGADVTRSWDVGDARWRVKGFAGSVYYGDFSVDDRTTIAPVYGLIVTREADGLLLRASVSRYRLRRLPPDFQKLDDALKALNAPAFAAIADEVDMLHQRVDFASVAQLYATGAIDYSWNEWQFTAEGERFYGHPLSSIEAGYVRAARRFGSVTGFTGYSRVIKLAPRVSTPAWAAALTPVLGAAGAQQVQALGSIAAYAINEGAPSQHTWSVGARWDLHSQLALKLQWDRVDTDEYGGVLWADATSRSAHSNVLSVTLDFVF